MYRDRSSSGADAVFSIVGDALHRRSAGMNATVEFFSFPPHFPHRCAPHVTGRAQYTGHHLADYTIQMANEKMTNGGKQKQRIMGGIACFIIVSGDQ